MTYEISEQDQPELEGGAEYRQFQGSPNRIFPIFDASANYTPFDGTLISLSGYRNDVMSYSEIGDNYVSTPVQLNLRQRFLRNFFFIVSGGYNLAEYQNEAGAIATTNGQRRDNYYFVERGRGVGSSRMDQRQRPRPGVTG